MAVSDYTPVYMTDFDELEKTNDLRQLLTQSNQESKISSASDYQVLFLKKTPKVIGYIKDWNPAIRLVGFKLLVNVPQEELFRVARASLERNRADYILANDLAEINKTQHRGYLLGADSVEVSDSKQAIADLVLERVTNHG